jgi:ribosomal-protein-alanine N-acetyltransferase
VCFSAPFRFSNEAVRRFAEAKNAWVVVAEKGAQLMGFCIVHQEEVEGTEVGYVVTIDVAEPWRRRGLGEEMLSRGEAWVRSWKGAGMMLHVFVKNESAVRFYERMEYGRVGLEKDFYGVGLDAALYWKELDFRGV